MDPSWIVVCRRDEVPPGTMRSFAVDGTDILVARKDDETFFAIRDRCPHYGAPLSKGRLGGTMLPGDVGCFELGREGEIVRCPWHAWEFDATTGCSLHDPQGQRVRRYDVALQGEHVLVQKRHST